MSLNLFAWNSFKAKNCSILILLMLFGEIFTSNAQTSLSQDVLFTTVRNNFKQAVQKIPADTSLSNPIIRNCEIQLNDIVTYFETNYSTDAIEKDKIKRSLIFFLQEVNKNLAKNKMHLYELNDAIAAYQHVVIAMSQHKQLVPVLMRTESNNSQLIAASFTQFKEYSLLEDIATYKRMTSSPEFIFQFLETKPKFRFADSLLLVAALDDPMNLVYYMRRGDPVLLQRIRNITNDYMRQVVSFSNDKYVTELSLFIPQIVKGTMKTDDIVIARSEPTKYFQLLVNTLLESKGSIAPHFLLPLKNGIREKALAFYVNEINRLHSSSDAVRFASVNGLRIQDLYFVITSCGDELYTSSYLGLYKRLVAQFNDQPVDALFDTVQLENFHVFIRMAANYNVLDDFLRRLSPAKMLEVLQFFIDSIEEEPGSALEYAMDIADSFSALCEAPQTCDMIQTEIRENLDRCILKRHYLGIRLYSILNDILQLSRQKEGLKKLWDVLGDYETLKHSSLENIKGQVTELVLFYGDEDGINSFNNFLNSYSDKSKWQIAKNKYWLSIQSLTDHPLLIYANLPLDIEKKSDLAAQDSLFAYLQTNDLLPAIIVHRGHSYHLDKTFKKMVPSVKLAILGSCGGYNKSISIAGINPDIQVIGSKKTGSKSINDPILSLINDELSKGKDISWPEIWDKLGDHFKKDEAMLNMFNEYFPPSHNLGLFVLKLYQSNTRLL